MIGGVFLGLMGAISPFILFSGQVGLSQLFVQDVDLGGFFLILIGLLKLLTTKVNIVTGWKGGEIFPMMFATAAIGVGVSMIVPAVPTMIAVAAIMTAAITIELENMLVSLAILAIFLPLNLALTMIIAGLVATATMRKNPINFKLIRRTVRQPEAS
jgi:H+/Cl- antiporter ClcA